MQKNKAVVNVLRVVGVMATSLVALGCAFEATGADVEGDLATSAEAVTWGAALPPDQCGAWRTALIDNLEDGDVLFGSRGSWVVFNDATGSQVPVISQDLAVPGGLRGSRYAVHSMGNGFTQWGAGFGVALGCGYDVKKYDGVRFKAKAAGARQFALQLLTLETVPAEFGGRCTGDDCNDFHQARLSLPGEGWYECTVPFGALAQAGWGRPTPLDLTAVSGVQWNFGITDLPYDLWVDDLEFSRRSTLGCVPLRASCN